MALCTSNIVVLQINEELNTLKSQNSQLIKDLEQMTAENSALQSELMLKNQNVNQVAIYNIIIKMKYWQGVCVNS